MKKTLATVACALAVVMALSVAPSSKNHGFLGVDVVSAATEGSTSTTPTKPTTPSKPTTPTQTSSTTTTTPSTTANISRTLKLGSKGSDVKSLQTLLNSQGYKLSVDGAFGKLTLAAVKDYQGKNGLTVDGVVGSKTLAKLTAGTTSTTTASTLKVYQGLGHTTVFRNGPGKDDTGVPVYSFSIALADATFDAQGRILNVFIDGYEVATPNYDGASMPHFSGWPGKEGYNVTDHDTGKVTGVSTNTLESATAEVKGWVTKRQRGDAYGMNPANEWYKQMNFYQQFFVGKTIDELEAWFAKNTTSAGRPIKANTTNADDLAKLSKLTDKEKSELADVVSGATMSLRDPHGDFLGAIKDAYNNRVEISIPVK